MATVFWYRIDNQFEITQHDNPDLSLKGSTKYWIEAVDNNRSHITSISKNKFELYDYNVFDNTIEHTQIKQQNLTCVKIYDEMANSWGTRLIFEIEDSEHLRKKCYFGSVYLESGKDADEAILDGISFMKKWGSNKTWEIIKLKQEIERNKKQIESLQKDVESLKEEVQSLKLKESE